MHPALRLLPLCALGLGLGLGLAWFGTRHRTPSTTNASAIAAERDGHLRAPNFADASHPATGASLAVRHSGAAQAASDLPGDTTAEPSSVSQLSDEARAAILAEIEAAYTTYDPAELPKIVPFLRHADAEVRTFAREAIVQLGHADGIPILRKAARETRDPREAAELLESAEFLALPSASVAASGDFPSVADR